MNMRNDKRGVFLNNILIIFVALVLFFMLFGMIDGVIDGVDSLAPDIAQLFLLNSMGAAILIGIVKAAYDLGKA